MNDTILMTKIFSDYTPDSFKDAISDSINEALLNGQAIYSDEGEQLYFASVDGSVIVEDKKNGNEITVAVPESDGSMALKSGEFDAKTQPNVSVHRIKGKDGAHLVNTVPEDKSNPAINEREAIMMEAGITDPELAGLGKHFSDDYYDDYENMEFSDYVEDLEMENEIYSDIIDNSLTFSDDEVENLAFSATELKEDVERLAGTMDMQLAYSIMDDADEIKAYSILAENYGHDCSDVIEACDTYSEYADEALDYIIANTGVNDYFSELTSDEVNDYFSELDEVESEILFSALQSGENYTFSEVEDMVNDYYSDVAMETPIFGGSLELTSDNVNDVFSDLTDDEFDAVYSELEDDPTLTFSDVNDILDEINCPVQEMFSDYTEDDFDELFSDMSDAEIEVFSDMMDDENAVYSDLCNALEEVREFSDDDAVVLADNANAIYSAFQDFMASPDEELAEQILYYSDQTLDDCYRAAMNGHDVSDVADMCMQFSEAIEDACCEEVDQVSPVPNRPALPMGSPTTVSDVTSTYSTYGDDGLRMFSQGVDYASSVNPCLNSPIN